MPTGRPRTWTSVVLTCALPFLVATGVYLLSPSQAAAVGRAPLGSGAAGTTGASTVTSILRLRLRPPHQAIARTPPRCVVSGCLVQRAAATSRRFHDHEGFLVCTD
jgi:hypothetical protein